MNYADVAPQPTFFAGWTVFCAGLSCLFLVSLVVLIVVLVKRSKREKAPPAA
jgi:hypothetical protein